ncbi:hypothetical protein, partial [Bradyrhizobium oropedii]|uniref:hypothetical protein n=1 Tax=Bradyrhizobium oropedii TaxID=1571201 RepID=UPI001E4FC7A3
MSCPTRQVVAWSNAGHRRLLCMGLFSIFWQRASPRVVPAQAWTHYPEWMMWRDAGAAASCNNGSGG